MELFFQQLYRIGFYGQFLFHMRAVLAASYIAIQAVERATAIWIDCVIIQEPRISPFGLVEYGLNLYICGHISRYDPGRSLFSF